MAQSEDCRPCVPEDVVIREGPTRDSQTRPPLQKDPRLNAGWIFRRCHLILNDAAIVVTAVITVESQAVIALATTAVPVREAVLTPMAGHIIVNHPSIEWPISDCRAA
jgi:hypothetical protein